MVRETPTGTIYKTIYKVVVRIFEHLVQIFGQSHRWLSFRHTNYKNTYSHKQLQPYNLPLLIDEKDVVDAYKQSNKQQYDFAYFGALQTFRNEKKIFDIFKKMNAKIDVFCYDNFESHPAVIKHKAVSGN